VNWADPESLHNITEQLNFYCVPKIYLGLIGATFLLGIVFGCLTVTRLGDTYGRKPVYFMGLLLQLAMTIVVIFSTSAIVDYVALFIVGISVTMRYYIGYTYNVELQPKSH
jgi:putative MFS transporter